MGQCWGDQRCSGDETRQLPSLFRPKGTAPGRSQVGAAPGEIRGWGRRRGDHRVGAAPGNRFGVAAVKR
jgi:hypothetical protein